MLLHSNAQAFSLRTSYSSSGVKSFLMLNVLWTSSGCSDNLPPVNAQTDVHMANDRIDANASKVAVIGAATLVIATGVAIIETLRFESRAGGAISMMPIAVAILGATLLQAEDKRNNKIDKENTGQQGAKLNFSSKESKEEVQAKDEMNDKIDEEFTGQQKAKLEVSLKESKEELRSSSCCTSEEFQSLEAKYHAKYENLLRKYFDKCHGWEEERSQLIKELGAARASSEIYRELLHGSDDF
ncbi:hypothetical protein RHMOL_Rhmol05G0065200 [Rhododendron molle]|uniref:Uncharacterized protein n=1 Tax=Rhododendron molle TaxID=49168 RepID=A0ACC0NLD2_RHOML|nr:hypothetical protein RHMOL_Rhmol05G0065200 [Rhododendron molle]